MSRTRYALYRGRRYYDWTTVDATGRPTLRWYDFESGPVDCDNEPQVGESITFQKKGNWYRIVIRFVHFRGMVYEDVEGYDVEYHEEELREKP